MCCFSAKTDVHETSIFARFLRPGVQALVYQMQYAATEPTAMILPLPVALPAKEDRVRFKSLKAYPTFFSELASGYPAAPSTGILRSKSAQPTAAAAAAPLAVHDVGDFVATFVPSIEDFHRLDPRFVIAKDVWKSIPEYADYGFAVFQLKELAGTPHPIAMELETRTPETLFFPTVHIHDGSVHEKDEFDHVLYAQEPAFDDRAGAYQGPDAIDAKTGFVRSKEKASSFANAPKSQGILAPDLLVHKKTLRGLLPNRDTTFELRAATASTAGACSRCDVSAGAALGSAWLPLTATLAGLGWIIRRRDERRRG